MTITPQQHILDICNMLLIEETTVESLLSSIGNPPQSSDYQTTTAQSVHPAFHTLTVIQATPDSDIPEFVKLTVADGQLTIGDLNTIFGSYHPVPLRLYEDPQVAYFYEPEDTIACTIFASYISDDDPNVHTAIEQVMIRKE